MKNLLTTALLYSKVLMMIQLSSCKIDLKDLKKIVSISFMIDSGKETTFYVQKKIILALWRYFIEEAIYTTCGSIVLSVTAHSPPCIRIILNLNFGWFINLQTGWNVKTHRKAQRMHPFYLFGCSAIKRILCVFINSPTNIKSSNLCFAVHQSVRAVIRHNTYFLRHKFNFISTGAANSILLPEWKFVNNHAQIIWVFS